MKRHRDIKSLDHHWSGLFRICASGKGIDLVIWDSSGQSMGLMLLLMLCDHEMDLLDIHF